MKETAQRFIDACEAGQGWDGTHQYGHADATSSARAHDLERIATLQAYAGWMKVMLVPNSAGSDEVRSFAVDEERENVAACGVFPGSRPGEGGPMPPTRKGFGADHVDVMQFEGEKIYHMIKIWNDGLSLHQLGWA